MKKLFLTLLATGIMTSSYAGQETSTTAQLELERTEKIYNTLVNEIKEGEQQLQKARAHAIFLEGQLTALRNIIDKETTSTVKAKTDK